MSESPLNKEEKIFAWQLLAAVVVIVVLGCLMLCERKSRKVCHSPNVRVECDKDNSECVVYEDGKMVNVFDPASEKLDIKTRDCKND